MHVPHHRHRHVWGLAALALAMLLPALGTSIANVALPALETAFAASFGDVQWVVLSYLLAVTTLIVGAGRLGDIVGRRRLLLGGIGIFALASAGAMIAPSLWVLVAARALQGVGAAVMMALTVASVNDVVPKERTGSAMGLLGTVSAVGTALGPSLGGVLLSGFRWPAVFGFMAVAGTMAFVFGLRMLPADAPGERKATSFDIAGMLLLALSLGAYALCTTLGGASPGAANIALAAVAVVSLTVFVVVERRVASPLVNMELLREHGLSSSLLSIGLVSTIVMATLVVGPFYLTNVLGLGPVQTGVVMSIGPGIAALVGLPAGRLVDRWGPSPVMVSGLLAVMAGAILMTLMPAHFGVGGYIGSLATITTGYALFQAANNTAVMAGTPGERRGLTSGLVGLARNLGLVSGASMMGAVFALGSRMASGLGMELTFGLAAALAGLALAVVIWGTKRQAI
jgi:MFS family permease